MIMLYIANGPLKSISYSPSETNHYVECCTFIVLLSNNSNLQTTLSTHTHTLTLTHTHTFTHTDESPYASQTRYQWAQTDTSWYVHVHVHKMFECHLLIITIEVLNGSQFLSIIIVWWFLPRHIRLSQGTKCQSSVLMVPSVECTTWVLWGYSLFSMWGLSLCLRLFLTSHPPQIQTYKLHTSVCAHREMCYGVCVHCV